MSHVVKPSGKFLPKLSIRKLSDPISITAGDIDRFSVVLITTTSPQNYIIPVPTLLNVDRLLYVVHDDDSIGTLTVNGISIGIGKHTTFIWDQDFWHGQEDKEQEAGSGITEEQHRALDQLVHKIAETSFEEVTRTAGQISDVIVWTDITKTVKIRETNLTYFGNKVITAITRQYDGTGLLVETLTEAFSYTGNDLDNITRVFV